MLSKTHVRGTVAAGFEEVREEFSAFITEERGEPGVHLVTFLNGRQVVDLWTGDADTGDSLTGIYSSGKGAACLLVALLVLEGMLDLDRTVAHYWSEFRRRHPGESGVARMRPLGPRKIGRS